MVEVETTKRELIQLSKTAQECEIDKTNNTQNLRNEHSKSASDVMNSAEFTPEEKDAKLAELDKILSENLRKVEQEYQDCLKSAGAVQRDIAVEQQQAQTLSNEIQQTIAQSQQNMDTIVANSNNQQVVATAEQSVKEVEQKTEKLEEKVETLKYEVKQEEEKVEEIAQANESAKEIVADAKQEMNEVSGKASKLDRYLRIFLMVVVILLVLILIYMMLNANTKMSSGNYNGANEGFEGLETYTNLNSA